ncbi:hypothetical protein SISSUDRAFT_1034104 [Sistotremastrum suecicum HHB10207 ss-3]|uniref:F-box domain-containing protein n=1 Tax=Sistotremastrum suecicum HHB10207 ss-3 TaxID=1314776 RepID=A0A166CEX2_9AGAM|nr:hypothetical protein SISSUDRAFT_1034104 [Sistotremastrum suecicum HHB10207 ss-3]
MTAARALSQLPYDVQEEVTTYLPSGDLFSLALASKYLAELAIRALYSHVSLHSRYPQSPGPLIDLRPNATLRMRQFSFLSALSRRPEYARLIRSIAFEFTDPRISQCVGDWIVPEELVWRAFAKCERVTSIDIKAPATHRVTPPDRPLFPNLRRARIEGFFQEATLDCILHTSPVLQELHFMPQTAEFDNDVGMNALPWHNPSPSPTLDPFLQRTVFAGALPSLCILQVDSPYQITSGAFQLFLGHISPHIQILNLTADLFSHGENALDEAALRLLLDETHWPQLTHLIIRGIAPTLLSPYFIATLRRSCPRLIYIGDANNQMII